MTKKIFSRALLVALIFGFSESIAIAALGRFFQGIGSAFAFVGVLTVAVHWFHATHFAFLVGVAQFLAALGAIGVRGRVAALAVVAGWRGHACGPRGCGSIGGWP